LNKNSLVKKTIVFFLTLALFSCASRKDLVYYQNIDGLPSKEKTNSYEVTIQPDDLLMIIVSTEDPEIALPFNLKTVSVVSPIRQDIARGTETNQLYLVDSAGFIDFPVLGKLKIGGMTRTGVLKMLQDKITVYIKNPVINLRIMNFKISVQGEVVLPGTYPVSQNG
jgi:polysaccharide export outer membrane protein